MTAHALPGTPLSSLLSLLNTQPNIPTPDDFYQELVDMHRDLSEQQSALVNAKLILLLANHVGDLAVLREAMRAARQDIAPEAQAVEHTSRTRVTSSGDDLS
jgi:GTP1/Obg family GTP-binding protein